MRSKRQGNLVALVGRLVNHDDSNAEAKICVLVADAADADPQ
jgi:hypothetical protein